MFSRAELISRYETLARDAEILKRDVDAVLAKYAREHRYLYLSRIKDRESFLQKLETGRFETTDFDDILATTLIVPTPREIPTCIGGLPAAIDVTSRRGPGSRNKEPGVFRFDEWLLISRLKRSGPGAPASRPFELQVTTITLHAWSQATHDLVFKGDRVDWRRERLAAQLRAMAEQADLLYAEFLRVSPTLPESKDRRTSALLETARGLESWIAAGFVPPARVPPSAVRFAESLVDLCNAVALKPAMLLQMVKEWFAANAYPTSLSLYQVCLGIALQDRTVDWSIVPKGFRVFVTTEALDIFKAVGTVPPGHTLRMGADSH